MGKKTASGPSASKLAMRKVGRQASKFVSKKESNARFDKCKQEINSVSKKRQGSKETWKQRARKLTSRQVSK